MVLAVLFSPGTNQATSPAKAQPGVLARLARARSTRQGARSPEYMLELSRQALGESRTIVHADEPAFTDRLRTASEIVLLWPDSIGSGWGRVERMVFQGKSPDARVSALNGRRRRFALDSRTLAGFRARRFLEQSWLGEITLAASLMVALPFLVVWDLGRGHK